MATPPITSRMSPPVDNVVDRELDRARKDFMDLVRTTDRQVRRDQGEGRGGSRRDREGREPDPSTPAPRADAGRRVQQPPQTQPQPVPQQVVQRDARDPARENALQRDQGTPYGRRSADRGAPSGRVGQEPQNVGRRPAVETGDAGRVVERRESAPPQPVAEREIDRRSSAGPGAPRTPMPGTAPGAPRGARSSEAAALVMPTADVNALSLVASAIGLAPAPYRLSSQTPPEIARRIAHFMRTGELDRSPVRLAATSPFAEPAAAGDRSEAIDDSSGAPVQPRLLPPFAQAQAGQTAGMPGVNVASLFAPLVNRGPGVDRRSAPVPMQAATLAAMATAPDAPYIGSAPEDANPFFDDYDVKSRERRKREEHAVVEALRRREDD